MEAFFNELSCYPLCDSNETAKQRVSQFVQLLKTAHANKFTIVRCPDRGISDIYLCDNYSLADFCNRNSRGIQESLILSMVRPPYFKEDSKEENSYIENNYSVEVVDDLGKTYLKSVYGMAAACLHKSIALNMCSCDFWQLHKYHHLIEQNSKVRQKVYSFSLPEDFNSEHYIQWQVEFLPRNFVDCGIQPAQKKCKLSSDHHGNKDLKTFARSLFKLPYITEVITSIPYSAYCGTFVKTIKTDSKRLELVLHWTEKGYGIEVQTTARTEIELRQIADELENRYGPK